MPHPEGTGASQLTWDLQGGGFTKSKFFEREKKTRRTIFSLNLLGFVASKPSLLPRDTVASHPAHANPRVTVMLQTNALRTCRERAVCGEGWSHAGG